jgi:hypothetical protein
MLAGCLYTLGQDVLSALMLATARVKRLIAVLATAQTSLSIECSPVEDYGDSSSQIGAHRPDVRALP